MRSITVLMVLMLGSSSALGQQLERSKGWAWSGIAASTLEHSRKPQPAPTPAPKPGDVCPACNGAGKVGDGRVFQTCRDCDGTGKVPSASLQSFRQSILSGPICINGRCDLPPAQPAAPLPSAPVAAARIESTPQPMQDCPGGVCPVPQSPSTYRSYQPQVVRRGWIFRR
jgi:hypothetical protein